MLTPSLKHRSVRNRYGIGWPNSHAKKIRERLGRLELLLLEDRLAPAMVWYVNDSAEGANTGLTWTDAYTDLQSALTNPVLQTGDQIWVAEGTYTPTTGTDRSISFALKAGVEVYGGFDDEILGQRDLAHNVSTLSGDIGTLGINTDNSYHVVTSTNLNATTVLDGFTVTGGKADGDPVFNQNKGGGLLNSSNYLTLRNVTFTSNSAISGGGMFILSASPTLYDVTFVSNTAVTDGGALQIGWGSPTLTNVDFHDNYAGNYGGAICANNRITDTVAIAGCVLDGNIAYSFGGAIMNMGGNLTITNGNFTTNSAISHGGAIYHGTHHGEVLTIRDSLFEGNKVSLQGVAGSGGAINNRAVMFMENCTLIGNQGYDAAGLYTNDKATIDFLHL